MDTDLVGAPGDGARRDPGKFGPRGPHHGIFGKRGFGVFLVADGHALVLAAHPFLGQCTLDHAYFCLGTPRVSAQ